MIRLVAIYADVYRANSRGCEPWSNTDHDNTTTKHRLYRCVIARTYTCGEWNPPPCDEEAPRNVDWLIWSNVDNVASESSVWLLWRQFLIDLFSFNFFEISNTVTEVYEYDYGRGSCWIKSDELGLKIEVEEILLNLRGGGGLTLFLIEIKPIRNIVKV